MKDIIKLDSETNTGYFFRIEDGKIIMRTCCGHIDYETIIQPGTQVGNEIMQEGIDEATAELERENLIAQMTKQTIWRHVEYFDKVIVGNELEIDGDLLKRTDGRLNLQKAAIINRNYNIVGGVADWDGIGHKVADKVSLVWK